MKKFFERIVSKGRADLNIDLDNNSPLARKITVLFNMVLGVYGTEKMIFLASKNHALHLMRSNDIFEKALALQRIIKNDKDIQRAENEEVLEKTVKSLEDNIADIIAHKSVENEIEAKVADKLRKKHTEYLQEIKAKIIKEKAGTETNYTKKKLDELKNLDDISLSTSIFSKLRPSNVGEIVGQKEPIVGVLSKLGSPYPQHIILYGPHGVGKTTTARVVLDEVKKLSFSPFKENAPFVEVDGSTLRWDSREITNPLLGSVHDPIYQGANKNLAADGVPEPKLGLVTKAHGGVLFIDEIGEMDPILQYKLLKVLEDKYVTFESAYFDPDKENIPEYIKKIFRDGAPADFILVGATTRQPHEINSGIRSRCTEIFFNALTPEHVKEIIINAAEKLNIKFEDDIPGLISEYTVEGRVAVNILADIYGRVLYKNEINKKFDSDNKNIIVKKEDFYEIVNASRLTPHVSVKASDSAEIGKVFGLGVSNYTGSVIEFETLVFPCTEKGKGSVRFNETAGSMTKDSVFNALSLIKKYTGYNIEDYNVHVNVIGGGKIDGPSAGLVILCSIFSSLMEKPVKQNIALTGEISIKGHVKPVGGIPEKIFAACRSNMNKVIIPYDNINSVPSNIENIQIIYVKTIDEVLRELLVEN